MRLRELANVLDDKQAAVVVILLSSIRISNGTLSRKSLVRLEPLLGIVQMRVLLRQCQVRLGVEFPLVLEEAESAQGIDDMICFVSTCHRVEVQDAWRLRSRTLVYIRHHVPREADNRKVPMLHTHNRPSSFNATPSP